MNSVNRLLRQRYFQPQDKNDWGNLVQRVATHVTGKMESQEFIDVVIDQLKRKVWLPNSPCLVNSGTTNNGLIACFVVGPDEDNLEHHVSVLGDIAAVGKRGGGCGFSGTNIRHRGAKVAGSAHGFAYGPNAWAIRVSDYLEMITQGGFRQMALMYVISSDHPDLDEFIDLKQVLNERFAHNFNQSIFASDQWMIDALTRENGAHDQLTRIAHNMWNNGEPGLLFGDTINNNTPYLDTIIATNPCGEQPLPSYGACVLASINVAHDEFFDSNGEYNFDWLGKVTRVVARFLDDVGEVNVFPNDKFKNWYEAHRPIGVGVMGIADLFLRQEIVYGSPESLLLLDKIMETIYSNVHMESVKLGQERGVPKGCTHVGRRNITLTTVAPTGSIAFLAGCSHGIEPIFAPSYLRTDERGEEYLFSHKFANEPFFRSAINKDPNKVVSWQQHIDIQAMAQKHVDSGVSKTINVPEDMPVKNIIRAIVYAWRRGCKGITVYRNNSRQTQVLTEQDVIKADCPTGVCEL